ncbi:MAG: molybdopterin-guanine dinucleotide biosynthesis protein B [Pseudomonadota bacterium]
MSKGRPAILGVAGYKNSGKTTLTSKLVRAYSNDGLRVSTVKHAHHAFDLDQPGTDTANHREAGAGEVAIVSARRWAIMHENRKGEPEPPLEDILTRLSPCELVIVEGYKNDPHPKIVLLGASDHAELLVRLTNVVAIALAPGVSAPETTCPVFDRDDLEGLQHFVSTHLRPALVRNA